MSRGHQPLAGDDGAPTDVRALHVEAELPRPLPQRCCAATHDPVHDGCAFGGQAALWGIRHTQTGVRERWSSRRFLQPRLRCGTAERGEQTLLLVDPTSQPSPYSARSQDRVGLSLTWPRHPSHRKHCPTSLVAVALSSSLQK